MYIPPFFKKRIGRFFLLGLVVGIIVAYVVFIFMYGRMYEQLLERNLSLQHDVRELMTRNEALLQDQKEYDTHSSEKITVQSIDLAFTNPAELKVDRLMLHQFNEILVSEISHIIGQGVESLAHNDALLISTIENKTVTQSDFTYSFKVERLIIAENVKLTLSIKMSE